MVLNSPLSMDEMSLHHSKFTQTHTLLGPWTNHGILTHGDNVPLTKIILLKDFNRYS